MFIIICNNMLTFVQFSYHFVVTGMHNLQQIYFDGENGEELDEFYDPQNNHLRCPDLKISNQFGELFTIQNSVQINFY